MPGREDIFQKAMNEGHSAAWDQEWDKASAAYRRALQEFPDNPKALNSLGLALYQLGNMDEALQIYINVAKLSPDDPAPSEKVAQISERLGDLKSAVDMAKIERKVRVARHGHDWWRIQLTQNGLMQRTSNGLPNTNGWSII